MKEVDGAGVADGVNFGDLRDFLRGTPPMARLMRSPGLRGISEFWASREFAERVRRTMRWTRVFMVGWDEGLEEVSVEGGRFGFGFDGGVDSGGFDFGLAFFAGFVAGAGGA